MKGTSGIGCISDSDPQPLLVKSHLGIYAVQTVGFIGNALRKTEDYGDDGNVTLPMDYDNKENS